MDAGSDGEGNSNRNLNQSPSEGQKKPKRQMKTPFQLEVLEKTYENETYPSEATRAVLMEKLGLTDRQLQMWFCHRRLKDKKEAAGMAAMKPRSATGSVGKRGLMDSPRDEMMMAEPGSENLSSSGSGSSEFDNGDEMPMVPIRYFESPRTVLERRVIACVEAQLGEPLREDGPILGVEFDELPPGAFGAPIVTAEHRERYRHSYDNKPYGSYDTKQIKAVPSSHQESAEPKIRSDAYGQVAPPYLYDSPVAGPAGKTLPLMQGNGHLSRDYGLEGQASSASILSQQGRQGHLPSPPTHDAFISNNEDVMQMERKRKSDEARIEREVQSQEKRIRKELEKQDLLRRKREEQMKKEMEKQDRERKKEELRMMREQQRKEERCQREEKREMERREKFMQKELLRAERKKQKEELRREKEAARQKAAMERAAARRIAKESLELIEDERLELMELAASSKGLPSIVSLDYDTLQGLESFRESLCKFPPESVKLKKPFAVRPWIDSEDNVGKLLMVWRFCITFADVLGLWPFTLDEFIQALHDYDSRLLGEIHIALLRMIIKDIEDVVRTPSGGPGTNQYSAVNPEGGHPHIVEGAYVWGFDIRTWQKHLNPLTWPEILRQFALSAGFGPQLKKKSTERGGLNDSETKGCEDIVSTLRNGSAAENAVAIMQEKGFSLQRKSRHRLTPGTVKFAAYHVLALEGSKGLNVLELADKIQKSGLRDLTTSKTPEASISVALSRDPILFERIAPSTYNVRPAYRKDPADAEAIISAAREKIQRFVNGVLTGQNAEDEERDDDSDCDVAEGPEVDDLGTPSEANKIGEGCNEAGTCSGNGKDILSDDIAVENEFGSDAAGVSNSDQAAEIDESRSGEPWVQGLTEGEYSELSVEERLNAVVILVGIANEGNSIRVILEDRLDAANAIKKQMWTEAQLDKRRMKEEIITKFSESNYGATAMEGSQSPLGLVDNRNGEASLDLMEKDEPAGGVDNAHNHVDTLAIEKSSFTNDASFAQISNSIQQNNFTAERSRMQMKAFIGHIAEEMYVYRSLPLGSDRRRNRYWLFVASPSSHDPGSGRIFVESPDGFWRLLDSEEAFDALSTSLDMRGIRESHLHIMLQKIEVPFRERVRKNLSFNCIEGKEGMKTGDELAEVSSSPGCNSGLDSPSSTVCGMNSDSLEPSSSFKIELGRNETERENALKRYEDFQIWMWRECFNSSVLRSLTYGKNRCTPLLGTCHLCFDSYMNVECHGHSCHTTSKVGNKEGLVEQTIHEEKVKVEPLNFGDSNSSHPLRIRLIKVLLNSLEASVPHNALQSSWTGDLRKIWAAKLLNASRTDDLLQILTQFEGAIKRDYLSSSFETTEELLCYCASSKVSGYDFAHRGSVSQLPWIPQTTSAVALRLLELDTSILHGQHEKPKLPDEKKVENLIKVPSKYSNTGDTQKVPTTDSKRDKQQLKEETWDYTGNASGSSDHKQVIRGRGSGRPRGRWPKGFAGSVSESGRRSLKHGGTLTEVLMRQGERSYGHKHGRGRRTVRKRRTEKKFSEETLPGRLGDRGSIRIVSGLPRHTAGAERVVNKNVGETEDNSNSTDDGVDSDDNAAETRYDFGKWDAGFTVAPHRNSEVMEMSDEEGDDSEDDNGGDEDGEGDIGINDYDSDRQGDDNVDDEGSDSLVSGDYSD
ncbi:homeobox-DDT domain protein RLT1 isoform X1 [Coffea eugenioides]|uniref:Homeobox-DDT domain protein RLT1-like isoform X1 n=1 Tax=Coffea arabica TaxID=13443 RepID=A0ABM4WTG8_COFAR|nr:homeobox-DDT domain protein RLT1 isoform X1 [Coffea eugenioides]